KADNTPPLVRVPRLWKAFYSHGQHVLSQFASASDEIVHGTRDCDGREKGNVRESVETASRHRELSDRVVHGASHSQSDGGTFAGQTVWHRGTRRNICRRKAERQR